MRTNRGPERIIEITRQYFERDLMAAFDMTCCKATFVLPLDRFRIHPLIWHFPNRRSHLQLSPN